MNIHNWIMCKITKHTELLTYMFYIKIVIVLIGVIGWFLLHPLILPHHTATVGSVYVLNDYEKYSNNPYLYDTDDNIHLARVIAISNDCVFYVEGFTKYARTKYSTSSKNEFNKEFILYTGMKNVGELHISNYHMHMNTIPKFTCVCEYVGGQIRD